MWDVMLHPGEREVVWLYKSVRRRSVLSYNAGAEPWRDQEHTAPPPLPLPPGPRVHPDLTQIWTLFDISYLALKDTTMKSSWRTISLI